jgi:uncharacterized membrane protein YqaE (UPF0057 family)
MRTLLAVVCPPAAVLLLGKPYQGVINLALTLLLYVPGVLHALSVVSHYNTQRRNETLMRLVSLYDS